MSDTILTAFAAQRMQDLDPDTVWAVTDQDAGYVGRFVGRPYLSGPKGAKPLNSVLVARSLTDLRFSLPSGLTRLKQPLLWPAGTLEMWGVP